MIEHQKIDEAHDSFIAIAKANNATLEWDPADYTKEGKAYTDIGDLRTGLDMTVSVDGSTMRGTTLDGGEDQKNSPGVRYFLR